MGNTICGRGSSSKTVIESQQSIYSKGMDATDFLTVEELDEYRIEQFIKEMKEYHLKRLRNELETDPQTFVLDNLLMCIQFFDHFERAKEEATAFKVETEKEFTEVLSMDPLEGQILGDRRLKLLTGMSHVIARKFIYKGKQEEDEDIDLLYGGLGYKDTFMAEGILPMEFTWTWDNLELYDKSEWKHLREYSNPKGESPIARFCVEHPEKNNDFGYVRLLCVDEPIHLRRKLDTPPSHPLPLHSKGILDGEESVYSKPYSDEEKENKVQEAHSSDEQHDSGPTSDDDDASNLAAFLISLPETKVITANDDKMPFNPTARNRPKLQKLNLSQIHPSLVVHAPTPTPPGHDTPTSKLQGPLENFSLLFPPSGRGRILDQPKKDSLSRDSPVKEISSGYETTSTHSQSSSMMSEQIRDRWQKLNLKKLWEFSKKTRKDFIALHSKYDPIPPSCYSEIKVEMSYENDLEGEDDDVFQDSSSTDSDSDFPFEDLSPIEQAKRLRKMKRKQSTEDETRFYLDSSQMSSSACSEFHYHGPKMGLTSNSMANGVVLGTTIRCPMPYSYPKAPLTEEEEESQMGIYYVTHTYTPALHSKSWPNGLYNNFSLHVNSQVNDDRSRRDIWPSIKQMEELEDVGCDAIPLGFRSMDFFNKEQMLEWELNFQDCEATLLNSFRLPHWRAYIFSSIIFRAFIAPLGPQGIGHEHIRNVLYFMCHENFSNWEDEQPGLHLKILLEYLYTYLSRSYMPSFFIRGRNLLKGIPQHNLRFVQGHLHKVRENLIVYCIYAFRNLVDVRGPKATFQFPDFKKLYEIITVQEAGLIRIINRSLKIQNDQEEQRKRDSAHRRAKRNKKRRRQLEQFSIDQQDIIDRDYFRIQREMMAGHIQPKYDPYQERLRKKHERYQMKLREHNKKVRELERLKKDPDHRIPDAEKRKSIDLNKSPIAADKFSPFRLLILIQFFLKHFLEMGEKCLKIRNYSNATMYMLQAENLLEIVQEKERWEDCSSPFEEEELDEYRAQTLRLRALLGKDMHQYILTRLDVVTPHVPYFPDSVPSTPVSRTFPSSNNWDLRKLPTPPQSEKDIPLAPAPTKILSKPNIASSLQSFEKLENPNKNLQTNITKNMETPVPNLNKPSETTTTIANGNNRPRLKKQESIKFVSSVIPKETPPSTPPRSAKALKQNAKGKMSISIELDTEVDESTDL